MNTSLNLAPPTARPPLEEPVLTSIADALRRDGHIVLRAPLPPAMLGGLLRHFRSLDDADFKRAGIGREEEHQLDRKVRSDRIFWLDRDNAYVSAYLNWMEEMRLGLNRHLILGLFDYECHYAYYDRGTFYQKHLDAFHGNTNRVLSTVLYLTPNWQPRDGGELALYPSVLHGNTEAEEPLLRVEPRFGQMVIFLSEEFPHEVLPVQRPRYSVTGWFRVNSSLGGTVDPAS